MSTPSAGSFHRPAASSSFCVDFLTPNNWKYGYDFRLKTMTLCEECNVKWLGPFEKRSKAKLRAWISGLKGPVAHTERSLLAFWAIKTAMTVDLAHPNGRRDIPAIQYRQPHANHDRPPVGVHIWAALRRGRLRGIRHMSRPFRFQHLNRNEVAPRLETHDGYQVAFLIGHLEIHLLGLGTSGADPLEVLPGEVATLVSRKSPFYRLWPLPDIPILSE
jgi:hypothetical protein